MREVHYEPSMRAPRGFQTNAEAECRANGTQRIGLTNPQPSQSGVLVIMSSIKAGHI